MASERLAPPPRFIELVQTVTGPIAGLAVEPALADRLGRLFPATGEIFGELEALCREGISQGWLCDREGGGIRYGRALRASPQTNGFSVDVVEMPTVAGPHHRHPNGEIDMVMPLDPDALFDGSPRGWKVYGPDSAHHPTVTGGACVILYLLPEGAIEFTGD